MEQELKTELKKIFDDKLSCPGDIEGLVKIIDVKNKVTKQLNNLYTKIEDITNYLDVPKKIFF